MREISEESRKSEPGVNLTEYWRILWRKKHFLLIPTILAGSVAAVGVRLIEPVYRSSSLIAIEDQSYLSREVEQFVNVSTSERRLLEEARSKARARLLLVGGGLVVALLAFCVIAVIFLTGRI